MNNISLTDWPWKKNSSALCAACPQGKLYHARAAGVSVIMSTAHWWSTMPQGLAHCDLWLHDEVLTANGIISCCSMQAHGLAHLSWYISTPREDVRFNYRYSGHQSKLMLSLFYTANPYEMPCHSVSIPKRLWWNLRAMKGECQVCICIIYTV